MKQIFLAFSFAIFAGCGTSHYKSYLDYSGETENGQNEIFWQAPLSGKECVASVKKIFESWEVVVLENKDLYGSYRIVASGFDRVYAGCLDASQVMVNFAETAPKSTKIAVVSQNEGLADFVKNKISDSLK